MRFELPPLPYPKHALEPHISRDTLETHYEKHHQGYLKKLRKQIESAPEAELALDDLVRVAEGSVFENAAQVWNHTFYWKSMSPYGGGVPKGELAAALVEAFGSYDKLREEILEAATGLFGSGWVWLVARAGGDLRVVATHDADNPLRRGERALLGLDVWEHAYYLDYRDRRRAYVETWLDHLADWQFAAQNWAGKR